MPAVSSGVRMRGLMHGPATAALLCLALCLMPGSSVYSQSAFYRYVDERGQVRYTDNPANIPPDQYRGPVSRVPLEDATADSPARAVDTGGVQRIVVNYDAGGGAILVHAILNRQYPVLFILDTGATSTMITEQDARALGIPLEGARRVRGLIADGSFLEMPQVRLSSLDVGGAQVNDIDVTVGGMRLLGLDFLGNFDMHINAQSSQLVLIPKGAAAEERSAGREPESEQVRRDREQSKRDIDNQISQLMIAIKTCTDAIEQYSEDIGEAESYRVRAEASLIGLADQGRFEGSGISRDQTRAAHVGRVEKNIEEIDAYIQNRRDNIALQQQQVAGMQARIQHLRELRRRIN